MSGAVTLDDGGSAGGGVARGCPTENELVAFLEGALAGDVVQVRRFEQHLDECPDCHEVVGVMLVASSSQGREPERAHNQESDAYAETLASDGPRRSGASESSALAPGSRLGRYFIIERVGAGGMGVVYAGYDPELDRKIALKLVRVPQGASASAVNVERARLLNEARALARLRHPNVIVVHDVGTDETGDVFVAMEFMDGPTLDQWLTGESCPQHRVIELFVGAGRGLAAAHAEGLAHRDFKPGNVMLDRLGTPRVLDFGLARPLGAEEDRRDEQRASAFPRAPGLDLTTPLTRTGALVGTPAYMSPEQFSGRVADARSDQFSFK